MLIIHNLAFERNQKFLFSDINEILHAGDVLQVCGANGSGKSTLLRIFAGLLEPHSGIICWKDKPIIQQKEIYFQQIHYLGHQNALKSFLTVKENLYLQNALLNKKNNVKHIHAVLEKINLKQFIHTPTLYLSAGQLRRLSLAKLLFNPVPLWILDEPATALDASGEQLLIDLLKQHQADGGLTILATHKKLALTNTKTIYLEAFNECH